MPQASLRCICRVLAITRSTLYYDLSVPEAITVETDALTADSTHAPTVEESTRARSLEPLVRCIQAIITEFPTYGYRRVCAVLRKREQRAINRKQVYRIMRQQGWLITQRQVTPKPRVEKQRSSAATSNERWAIDVIHVVCGTDGWAHLTAVIDCHDRAIVGFEFALRGRAVEAERALEMACLERFGTVRPSGATPVVRSDNGLIFQSRRFRNACQFYRLNQEYITPYTPQQNGLIERFFRSFKEECVWQHNFQTFAEANRAVQGWIRWYNEERPHQALGYQSPHEYWAAIRGTLQPDPVLARSSLPSPSEADCSTQASETVPVTLCQ